jgi:hypothetical protein
MSMSKVSMALDDVIKADRKANKGNKNGKNNSTGANKKNGNAKRGAARQPATAQLVKKLVKRALAQRGVGVAKPRNIRQNTGNRTVVKKVIRNVAVPARGNRNNRSLGVSQRSRTIVRRRVIPAPQPTRTVVREIRYVREPPRPAPRVQRRVVYEQPRPAPRRVVYVDSPRQRYNDRRGRSSFSSRRPAPRRNNDPFYEPRNFLQRVTY